MAHSSAQHESVRPVAATNPGGSEHPAGPYGELHRADQIDPESGEPAVDWQPIDAPLRIVGPGRREVRLRAQVSELEESLEVARLVERGTARYVDRFEDRLTGSQSQVARLAASMGALAAENQGLRAALERAERRVARLDAPRPSALRRILASVTGRRA